MAHSVRLWLKTFVMGSNPRRLWCLSSKLCIWWDLSWHHPPNTGFQIWSLVIWGSERYLSVTEIPHKKNLWNQSIGVGHNTDSGLLSVAILPGLSREQFLPTHHISVYLCYFGTILVRLYWLVFRKNTRAYECRHILLPWEVTRSQGGAQK